MYRFWVEATAVAVLAGALIGSVIPVPIFAAALSGILAIGIVRLAPFYSVGILIVCAFTISAVRASEVVQSPDPFEAYYSTPVEVVGIIAREPDFRETETRYQFRVHTINGSDRDGFILLVLPLHQVLTIDTAITFSGKLQKPEPFLTDTGHMFNYPLWLKKDGITAVVRYPIIESIAPPESTGIRSGLAAVKKSFVEKIQMALPEPHASLGAGLLLGARHSLGEDVVETFRIAGLSHIVVLSGYNLSIIADAIGRSLSFLPLAFSLSGSIVAVVVFAVMVGGGATVVRATIMALIAIVARATGRTYGALRALSIAGAAMALHNPLIVLHDPGFQLSFLATLGLIVLGPLIEPRLTFLARVPTLRAIAASTIAAQIGVLPLLMYMTGELSVVSFPANLLVLPLIPLAMGLVFIVGILGFISTGAAGVIGIPAYAILTCILWGAHFFAGLPFAIVPISGIVGGGIAVLYIGGAWYALRRSY